MSDGGRACKAGAGVGVPCGLIGVTPFFAMHRPARADTGGAPEAGGSASGPGVKWSVPSTRPEAPWASQEGCRLVAGLRRVRALRYEVERLLNQRADADADSGGA